MLNVLRLRKFANLRKRSRHGTFQTSQVSPKAPLLSV